MAPPRSVAEAVLASGEDHEWQLPGAHEVVPGVDERRTLTWRTVCASCCRGCGGAMAARTSIPLKRSRSTLGLRPPGCRDPHYDGARADAAKPAVIAVSRMRPVRQKWVGQRFLPRDGRNQRLSPFV